MTSALSYSNFQTMFTSEHNQDMGRTTQKLPFVPNRINNKLFGEDEFERQRNHNPMVMVSNPILLERGAESVLMDLSNI